MPHRIPDDVFKDPAAIEWMDQVLEGMAPKLRDSALSITVVPDDRHGDVKFWVELGASIMMDKPIIAVVFNNRPVPEKLKLVADEIVELPEGVNPEASEKVTAALERVFAKVAE